MKRDKKRIRVRWLLHPQNLQKQIDEYGYCFSICGYLISVAAVMGGIIVCGIVFSLRWYMTFLLEIAAFLLLPGMVLDGYKNMYEHKRFLELSDYMEQMLYAFRIDHKILTALKDTGMLFPEGKMHCAIDEAVSYIETGKFKENLYKEALGKIEREYPGRRIAAIHQFMQTVERNGGDCEGSIRLLLEDKAVWVENTVLLQEEKKSARTRILIALGITMILAGMFHGIYRTMPEEYSIVNHAVTQSVTTLYLILNLLIFRKAGHELAGSWIGTEEPENKVKIRRYRKAVEEQQEKKQRKISMVCAVPAILTAIICIWKDIAYGAAGAVLMAVLLLNQHKIAYRISYEKTIKEIHLRFPQWLMELALLLQGNNVQVAIEKTIPGAPAVFCRDLKELVKQLKEQPGSIEPYLNFLNTFQLSFVQSAMKMLYAISESGSGDTQEQIQIMVRRNGKLLDKSEKLKNEAALAGISAVSYYPQITISFQMMANLAVFIMVFLTKLGIG